MRVGIILEFNGMLRQVQGTVRMQGKHGLGPQEQSTGELQPSVIDLVATDLRSCKGKDHHFRIELLELTLEEQQGLVGPVGLHSQVYDLQWEVFSLGQTPGKGFLVQDSM